MKMEEKIIDIIVKRETDALGEIQCQQSIMGVYRNLVTNLVALHNCPPCSSFTIQASVSINKVAALDWTSQPLCNNSTWMNPHQLLHKKLHATSCSCCKIHDCLERARLN